MRMVFFLSMAFILLPFVYAHVTGMPHNESTTDLVMANTSPKSAITATAVNVSKPSNFSADNRRCVKEFECKIASKADRTFWFGCSYDSVDNQCRCFEGALSQCILNASSVTVDDLCAYQFECVRQDGYYQFNCHLDRSVSQCRCFVGELSQCRAEKSLFDISLMKKEPEINASPITGLAVTDTNRTANVTRLGFFAGLSKISAVGLVVGVVAAVFVVLLVAFMARPKGDLEQARRLHKKAEELHEKGMEDDAHKHYALAEEYRVRARKG